MELNDVKAGKYQLVAVRWDQITSKPGEPLDYVRHRKGAIVDLTAEDAKRLVAAGAVVKPGELEKSKAEQARALAERANAEYQAILAGLPEDVRAEVAPQTVPQVPDSGGRELGVADILKEIGDDKAKASEVLEKEKAGKNRKTLVEPLEKLLAGGSGDGS